ncbi:MAG: crotonase/enoyl-CoA hydratase family protein [Halioglobus sp.]
MTTSEALQVTRNDHIAHVRLNRPEAHNAIESGIMNGLIDFARSMQDPGDIRTIVISGNGRSFCAGLDMSAFAEMQSGELSGDRDDVAAALRDISPGGANRAQQVGWLWQEVPIPVIAAVQGAALGGGLNLALGADIRIVHPDATLAFVEITWGLLPDMSASQSLRRLVALDRIKELVFTGRKFSGEDALRYGIATEVSESPVEDALAMAATIARHNPDALRAAKQLLNQSALVSVADGLAHEAAVTSRLLGTPNQLEAVGAQLEGREPDFQASVQDL